MDIPPFTRVTLDVLRYERGHIATITAIGAFGGAISGLLTGCAFIIGGVFSRWERFKKVVYLYTGT